jgi:hypothetical protein
VNIQLPWTPTGPQVDYGGLSSYGGYGSGGSSQHLLTLDGSLGVELKSGTMLSGSSSGGGSYSGYGLSSPSPAGGTWYGDGGIVYHSSTGEILRKVDPGPHFTHSFNESIFKDLIGGLI